VYSWDLVIEKFNGMVFFDKREDSNFDLLTVSETARDPPTVSDDVEEFNQPTKLSLEATMINQNFTQQILKEGEPEFRKTVSNNSRENNHALPCRGQY
jgi:translation initiation factor 3 subunit D